MGEYTHSSRNETIHNSHHRSRSSPPSEDIYARQIKRASGKTDNRNQYIYGSRNQNNENNKNLLNGEVHYSTIDHSKGDYLKSSSNNNTTTRNVCNGNYVNNNITCTENDNLINNREVMNECNFLHIEREIPMHSTSLEAQKFKTIIFLSGQ